MNSKEKCSRLYEGILFNQLLSTHYSTAAVSFTQNKHHCIVLELTYHSIINIRFRQSSPHASAPRDNSSVLGGIQSQTIRRASLRAFFMSLQIKDKCCHNLNS
jgi:hypothetical protein